MRLLKIKALVFFIELSILIHKLIITNLLEFLTIFHATLLKRRNKMKINKIRGIGWDVGGWMGTNHGIAICEWERLTNEIHWSGTPAEISLPSNDLLSLKQITAATGTSYEGDADITIIGVDAPLGYPIEYINLLNGQLPQIVKPSKEIENPLAYRATDKEIYNVFGKKPLSAAFDRIGNNATLAMLHTRMWEQEHGFKVYPIRDREVNDDKIIIEVYPALVKKRRDSEVFEEFRPFLPHGVNPGTDAYDACICALYSIALLTEGKVLPKLVKPEEEIKAKVKKEGWIYYFPKKQ